MPELPEAETIARGLRSSVVGRSVTDVDVLHEDVLPQGAEAFREGVRRRSIGAVGRRGKNLVLTLDDDSVVLVNLGMTGKLLPVPGSNPTHPAVRFRFEEGGALVYDDVRRFGRVEVLGPEAWTERSDSLGPEPLDPTLDAAEVEGRLGGSRSPIRNILLDQGRIAGVGNIYANEALHRARIHPRRPARALDQADFGRLLTALRELMNAAIDAGGTTIRDYRDASGRPGRYSRQLRVYDREGEPCRRCGETVERIVFGNRSAFFCPRCQPADGT